MHARIRLFIFFALIGLITLLSGCGGLPGAGRPNTSNKTAHRIHQSLATYAQKAKESWSPIYPPLPLKAGSNNSSVPAIRHRLIVLEDLSASHASKSTYFDSAMTHGVMQFQWRHGLRATGVIDKKTLHALNVSPAQRYRELIKSMYQWAELPEDEGSHYIHVNIPSFKMSLIRDGHQVMNMKVIAGRRSRPTPTLYSKVKTIVFNPTWTVPKTILARDVIPGMQNNLNYMREHHNMKLYSSWDKNAAEIDPLTVDWHSATASNFRYRVTAPPGDDNPLGRVKFIFENDHDVYMHDTPAKGLFSRIERAYSSGCIRLERPFHLVEYFYPDNADLDYFQVSDYLSSNQTKYIQLKNPIPIHVTYITAWVDHNGKIHFREDIYANAQNTQA